MKRMSKKEQLMAYLLNRDPDFGYAQKKIGDLMGHSQSVISNAVNKVEHAIRVQKLEEKNHLLEEQLASAKEHLHQLGYKAVVSLPPAEDNGIIDVTPRSEE